jgi:hypothetical protein
MKYLSQNNQSEAKYQTRGLQIRSKKANQSTMSLATGRIMMCVNHTIGEDVLITES